MINREQLLGTRHQGFPIHVDVEVPGLGMVKVKKLRAGEKDRFEAGGNETVKSGKYRARTVAFTAMDDRGIMLFSEDDIPDLMELDPDVLDPIVKAAIKLNRYTEEDQAELRKN